MQFTAISYAKLEDYLIGVICNFAGTARTL